MINFVLFINYIMMDYEGYYIVPDTDRYYHVRKDNAGNYEFIEHISTQISMFDKWNPIKLMSLEFKSDNIPVADNPHIKLSITIPLTWKLNLTDDKKTKLSGYYINGFSVKYISYTGNGNLYNVYNVLTDLSHNNLKDHIITIIPLTTRIYITSIEWSCDMPKTMFMHTKEELRKYLNYDQKHFGCN
jgi:hypothetical protein